MMKCRIWRTGVVEGRIDEYETFAREISLPMFRAQKGYRGAIMGGAGKQKCVITYWEDDAAVATLDRSPTYKATVDRIIATGFLMGEQSVELYDVELDDMITNLPADAERSSNTE